MKKLLLLVLFLIFLLPTNAYAFAPGDNLFTIPNFSGFTNIGEILQALLTLAFFVAGVALLFNIIIGGIQWINAGGDPKAMTSARTRITNAVIGLIIVVAAYAIAVIVGLVDGISTVHGFKFVSVTSSFIALVFLKTLGV